MVFDILLSVVIALYLGVACVAFMVTASERQRAGMRRLWPRLLSALACLIWPLVLGIMVVWQKAAPKR